MKHFAIAAFALVLCAAPIHAAHILPSKKPIIVTADQGSTYEWRLLTKAEAAAYVPTANARGYGMPPKRFDYFNPNIEVVAVPMNEVDGLCEFFGVKRSIANRAARACSQPKSPPCIIVMPTDSPYMAALFRHEMAHCNGWWGNHPN